MNAASALHAAGSSPTSGSAATARTSAPCVVTATSPRVELSDAKCARRMTRPVRGSDARASAAAKNARLSRASKSAAVARNAAPRTRGDGSERNTRASVWLGDRGNNCPTLVGKSAGHEAWSERGLERANAATHAAAAARARDAP